MAACVTRSAALVWGWGRGGGEACVGGDVCLEEIRKIKTEALVDSRSTVFLKTSTPQCVFISDQEVFLEFVASSSAQRCFILRDE